MVVEAFKISAWPCHARVLRVRYGRHDIIQLRHVTRLEM